MSYFEVVDKYLDTLIQLNDILRQIFNCLFDNLQTMEVEELYESCLILYLSECIHNKIQNLTDLLLKATYISYEVAA